MADEGQTEDFDEPEIEDNLDDENYIILLIVADMDSENLKKLIKLICHINAFFKKKIKIEYQLGNTKGFSVQQSEDFDFYIASELNRPGDYDKILYVNKTCPVSPWRSVYINRFYSLNPKYTYKKIQSQGLIVFPKLVNIWRLIKVFFEKYLIYDDYNIESQTMITWQNLNKFKDIKMVVDTKRSQVGFTNILIN